MSDVLDSEENVVRLVTRRERDEIEEQVCRDESNAEAIELLEAVLEKARDGTRVVGVAIAIAYGDHGFASVVPNRTENVGALIAGLADCQHRILSRLDTSHEED